MGVMFVFVREFIVGALTPRGFGIAIILTAIALGISVMILLKRFAKEISQSGPASGKTIEILTGKQRLCAIWLLRGGICLLVFGLITGFREDRGEPLLATLVSVAINLSLTACLAWVLYRLQKSPKQP